MTMPARKLASSMDLGTGAGSRFGGDAFGVFDEAEASEEEVFNL